MQIFFAQTYRQYRCIQINFASFFGPLAKDSSFTQEFQSPTSCSFQGLSATGASMGLSRTLHTTPCTLEFFSRPHLLHLELKISICDQWVPNNLRFKRWFPIGDAKKITFRGGGPCFWGRGGPLTKVPRFHLYELKKKPFSLRFGPTFRLFTLRIYLSYW